MFGLTIWVLLRRRRTGTFNFAMSVVACLLLVLSTLHMCIDIDRLFTGFIKLRKDEELVKYFGDISQATYVTKNAIYALQTVLGDSVVIYRAYVVWQSVKPIIIPSIILGGVAASAIGSVVLASLSTPTASLSVFEQASHWVTAFFSSTLACNLIGTLTLAYRLWTLDRSLRHVRASQNTFLPIVLICVDSGLLYSIFLISALILLVRGSRAQLIVMDMISPIISISFYAIILRVEIVKARRERKAPRTNAGFPSLGPRGLGPTAVTNTNLSFAPHSRVHSPPHSHSESSDQTISLTRSERDDHSYPPIALQLDISGKLMDTKSLTE